MPPEKSEQSAIQSQPQGEHGNIGEQVNAPGKIAVTETKAVQEQAKANEGKTMQKYEESAPVLVDSTSSKTKLPGIGDNPASMGPGAKHTDTTDPSKGHEPGGFTGDQTGKESQTTPAHETGISHIIHEIEELLHHRHPSDDQGGTPEGVLHKLADLFKHEHGEHNQDGSRDFDSKKYHDEQMKKITERDNKLIHEAEEKAKHEQNKSPMEKIVDFCEQLKRLGMQEVPGHSKQNFLHALFGMAGGPENPEGVVQYLESKAQNWSIDQLENFVQGMIHGKALDPVLSSGDMAPSGQASLPELPSGFPSPGGDGHLPHIPDGMEQTDPSKGHEPGGITGDMQKSQTPEKAPDAMSEGAQERAFGPEDLDRVKKEVSHQLSDEAMDGTPLGKWFNSLSDDRHHIPNKQWVDQSIAKALLKMGIDHPSPEQIDAAANLVMDGIKTGKPPLPQPPADPWTGNDDWIAKLMRKTRDLGGADTSSETAPAPGDHGGSTGDSLPQIGGSPGSRGEHHGAMDRVQEQFKERGDGPTERGENHMMSFGELRAKALAVLEKARHESPPDALVKYLQTHSAKDELALANSIAKQEFFTAGGSPYESNIDPEKLNFLLRNHCKDRAWFLLVHPNEPTDWNPPANSDPDGGNE